MDLIKFRVHFAYNVGLEISRELKATVEVEAFTRASAERLASTQMLDRSWRLEYGNTENLGVVQSFTAADAD